MRTSCERDDYVIAALVRVGADVNRGRTALRWASGAASIALAGCFLHFGAQTDLRDSCGRTRIDRARETGDEDILALLVESE